MIYLLDTNVISETIKNTPNIKVLAWLQSIDMLDFSLSVLTLGEIRQGATQLRDNIKKNKIVHWLETELLQQFEGRIIQINQQVADKWGYIGALYNLPAIDGLIAASAIVHNQKLVTRNVKDFERIGGLEIINPWEL